MVFAGMTVKKKITMTVDGKIFAAFKQFCGNNAMKVSSKVELMMRQAVVLEEKEHEVKTTSVTEDEGGAK
jgi:hypothetical protein